MESDTLEFSKGKAFIIIILVAFGIFYALPNLFPDVPVVQISGVQAGNGISQSQLATIEQKLKAQNIDYTAAEVKDNQGLITFTNTEDQLKAKDVISNTMGADLIAALNLMPTTPDWLSQFGAKPMSLGLDLQGGVHFLLEVDLNKAIQTRLDAFREEARQEFQENRWYYSSQSSNYDEDDELWSLRFEFTDESFRDSAAQWMNSNQTEFDVTTDEHKKKFIVSAQLKQSEVEAIGDDAIGQNLQTLRNRVNEIGVAEPLVQRQGPGRIVVELPGVQDTAQAKRIIGKTANLEFRLVDMQASPIGSVKASSERFDFRGETERTTVLKRSIIVTGERVLDARSGLDENGLPQVSIGLDSRGGKGMQNATMNNIGNDMAVLFIEQKSEMQLNEAGEYERVTREEKSVINQATIQDVLGNRFVITGLDSKPEAAELALLLRAGALAAPMYVIEESTIGPSLGKENIAAGTNSALIGLAFVMLFMLVYYKAFGLVANIALLLNMILLIALLSMFSATLTLPGIGGIVLTVGMAVDANVLIFSRIREELDLGKNPVDAINAGYERAFVTIVDSNLTTFVVALILFLIGSGPIKGFAVTLSIGIVTSVFTSVVVSRAIVTMIYGRKQLNSIWI